LVGEDRRLAAAGPGAASQHPSPRPTTSGVAVTKNSRPASGQITFRCPAVENGAAGSWRKVALSARSAARTSGIAETIDAASTASWLLSAASYELRPGRLPRGAGGLQGILRAMASARSVCAPLGRQGRCRDGEPVMGREPRCTACPAEARRSVDRDDHVNPGLTRTGGIPPALCVRTALATFCLEHQRQLHSQMRNVRT